jgi:hypothetical protein
VQNHNRPAVVLLTISALVLLALIAFTRSGGSPDNIVPAGQISDAEPTELPASATTGPLGSSTEVAAVITAVDATGAAPTSGVSSSDEVVAVVQTAETSPPRSAGISGGSISGTATTIAGEVEEAPDGGTTTTTESATPDTVGICVFPDGTIASPLRRSVCPGFFTTDLAEATQVANAQKASSTTTELPTASTVLTATTLPTATTAAPTTTTTTNLTTTTTTTTAVAPTTTAAATTVPQTSLPPTSAPTTTTTTEKKRGRKGGND